MQIILAFLDEKPIASILCYYTPSICYISKAPYYDLARKNNATSLLFCEAIRDACRRGYKLFEFGTTNTTSIALWKGHFKAIKIPMRIYEKRYSKNEFTRGDSEQKVN